MSTNIEETKTEDIMYEVILSGTYDWEVSVEIPKRRLHELMSEQVKDTLNGGDFYLCMKEVMDDLGGKVLDEYHNSDVETTGYELVNSEYESFNESKSQ